MQGLPQQRCRPKRWPGCGHQELHSSSALRGLPLRFPCEGSARCRRFPWWLGQCPDEMEQGERDLLPESGTGQDVGLVPGKPGACRQREVGRAGSALLGASVTWGFLAGTWGGTEHSSLTQQAHRLFPQPPPLCGPAITMDAKAFCILLSAFSNLSPRGFGPSGSAGAPGCGLWSTAPLHGVCLWGPTLRLVQTGQGWRAQLQSIAGAPVDDTMLGPTGLPTLGSADIWEHPLWWGLPCASQEARQCPRPPRTM